MIKKIECDDKVPFVSLGCRDIKNNVDTILLKKVNGKIIGIDKNGNHYNVNIITKNK